MKKEKDKALEQVLADIEKQFGKGAIMKLGEKGVNNIDVVSSGSIMLDNALGVIICFKKRGNFEFVEVICLKEI